MHAVVMGMGRSLSPFKLRGMGTEVICLRFPSGAHDIHAFLGILVICCLWIPSVCAHCAEIAELLIPEKLIHPVHVGPELIEVLREERQVHAFVDRCVCASCGQVVAVGIAYHGSGQVRLNQRADVLCAASDGFPGIIRNIYSVLAAKHYCLSECNGCHHVIDWGFLHVDSVIGEAIAHLVHHAAVCGFEPLF